MRGGSAPLSRPLASQGVAVVGAGDLVRRAARAGGDVGRQCKEYSDQGLLVPSHVIDGMVLEELTARAGAGFILVSCK